MRAEKHQQIGDPDHREPQVGVPFRLGVFLRLRDAEQIAGAGDEDEEVVAEHDEPRREVADEPRAAGPLHHVERRRDQHVAAEREDDRGGVQRPDAAERDPRQIEIQDGKGQLQRRPQAHREAGDAPEHRGDGRELDRAEIVVRLAVDRERRQLRRPVVVAVEDLEDGRGAGGGKQIGVERVFGRVGFGRDDDREHRQRRKRQRGASLAKGHAFGSDGRLRHEFSPVPLDGRSRELCLLRRQNVTCARSASLMQVKTATGCACQTVSRCDIAHSDVQTDRPTASVNATPQGRHSNVCNSGRPPTRGVTRASFMGWPQFGQRGVFAAVFIALFLVIERLQLGARSTAIDAIIAPEF